MQSMLHILVSAHCRGRSSPVMHVRLSFHLSVCLSVCPFTFLSVSHSLAANSSDVSLLQSIWIPQGCTCELKSDCRPVSETQHVSLNIPCEVWYSEGFVKGSGFTHDRTRHLYAPRALRVLRIQHVLCFLLHGQPSTHRRVPICHHSLFWPSYRAHSY